jgi:hypothetical protein
MKERPATIQKKRAGRSRAPRASFPIEFAQSGRSRNSTAAIASGTSEMTACEAFDADANDAATVDELVIAVNNALFGCGTLAAGNP